MPTINERFREAREILRKSQEEFASKASRTRSEIKNIEYGKTNPKPEVVQSVCQAWGIDRTWLETGEGEPFLQGSRDEQIADFMNDVMKSESDDFRRRMIAALSKLSVAEWEVLESMAVQMAAEAEQERSGKRLHVVKIAGRDGALEKRTLTDEEIAKLDKLPDVPEGL